MSIWAFAFDSTQIVLWLLLLVNIFLAIRVHQFVLAALGPNGSAASSGPVHPQDTKSIHESTGKKDDTDMYGSIN